MTLHFDNDRLVLFVNFVSIFKAKVPVELLTQVRSKLVQSVP